MNMSFIKNSLDQYQASLPKKNIDSARLTKLVSCEKQALDSLRQRIKDDRRIHDRPAEQQLGQSIENLNDLMQTLAFKNVHGQQVSLYTASKMILSHIDSRGHFTSTIPHGQLIANVDGMAVPTSRKTVDEVLKGMRYLASNAQKLARVDLPEVKNGTANP